MPAPTDHGPALDLDSAEALLRRLEFTVRNKLDGLLQGNYQGLVPGPGSEAGEARQYVVGDDVRRMDWAVTARTTVPHVRQTIADRELETWLVVDLSPSVDFGTGLTEKRELVLAAITAVVHLTVRGGNRVGAIVGNGFDTYVVPARGGRAHARHLMRRIATTPRAPGGLAAGDSRGRPDLTAMLESLRRPQRRRGLVAVVSDFIENPVGTSGADYDNPNWERALRSLSDRHQLLGGRGARPARARAARGRVDHFRGHRDRTSGRGADVGQAGARPVRGAGPQAAGAHRGRPAARGCRTSATAHGPGLDR